MTTREEHHHVIRDAIAAAMEDGFLVQINPQFGSGYVLEIGTDGDLDRGAGLTIMESDDR